MPKQAATWYEEKKGRTKRGKNKVHTKINPRNPQVKKTKKKNNSKNKEGYVSYLSLTKTRVVCP